MSSFSEPKGKVVKTISSDGKEMYYSVVNGKKKRISKLEALKRSKTTSTKSSPKTKKSGIPKRATPKRSTAKTSAKVSPKNKKPPKEWNFVPAENPDANIHNWNEMLDTDRLYMGHIMSFAILGPVHYSENEDGEIDYFWTDTQEKWGRDTQGISFQLLEIPRFMDVLGSDYRELLIESGSISLLWPGSGSNFSKVARRMIDYFKRKGEAVKLDTSRERGFRIPYSIKKAELIASN